MPYIVRAKDETYAVVTIEEAREAARTEVTRSKDSHDIAEPFPVIHFWRADDLPESGGTVGPLPDGRVIEVTQVCWNWIIGKADDAGIDTDLIHDDAPMGQGDIAILHAYNKFNRETRDRLEYLRGQLRAECISWGELAELQGLAEHIEPGDVELLEPAGVPEEVAYDRALLDAYFRDLKKGLTQ